MTDPVHDCDVLVVGSGARRFGRRFLDVLRHGHGMTLTNGSRRRGG